MMTAKEFSRGLLALAKKHENDEVTVFGTDWARLCRESAELIQSLDLQVKDLKEKLSEVQAWYDSNESTITKALSRPDEVDLPFNVIDNQRPDFVWDGVRRDGNSKVEEKEDEDD